MSVYAIVFAWKKQMQEPLAKMSKKPSVSRLFVCERLAVPTKKQLK